MHTSILPSISGEFCSQGQTLCRQTREFSGLGADTAISLSVSYAHTSRRWTASGYQTLCVINRSGFSRVNFCILIHLPAPDPRMTHALERFNLTGSVIQGPEPEILASSQRYDCYLGLENEQRCARQFRSLGASDRYHGTARSGPSPLSPPRPNSRLRRWRTHIGVPSYRHGHIQA